MLPSAQMLSSAPVKQNVNRGLGKSLSLLTFGEFEVVRAVLLSGMSQATFETARTPIETVQPAFTAPETCRANLVPMLGLLSRIVLAGVCALLISGLCRSSTHNKQLAALSALSSFKYPSQLEQARALCTQGGAALLPHLTSDSGFAFSTFKVAGCKMNVGECEVQMVKEGANGIDSVSVRLVDQGGWKFDDVKFVTIGGQSVNLWASHILDHPFASSVKLGTDQLAEGWKNVVSLFRGLD